MVLVQGKGHTPPSKGDAVGFNAAKSGPPALVTTLTSIPRQKKPTIEGRGFGFKRYLITN
tara:strand:+ start:24 stop:203 length:180 start_codon:yes stop_codon:yes gene_type:complete